MIQEVTVLHLTGKMFMHCKILISSWGEKDTLVFSPVNNIVHLVNLSIPFPSFYPMRGRGNIMSTSILTFKQCELPQSCKRV